MVFLMCYLYFFLTLSILNSIVLLKSAIVVFSSTGCRPASLCHGPSCVCPSVRALTFSLNIFFSETTYRILMKFHRNVPAMVLFRIYLTKFDSVKNCGCHGNKTEKKLKILKIFLSETMRPRATKIGM